MKECENWDTQHDCEGMCNTTCFACGKPACPPCSTIVAVYYRWKDKRVCRGCLDERQDDVQAGQIVLSGFKKRLRFPRVGVA